MVIFKLETLEAFGFQSLKFKNCCGKIFFNTDWIAGVDYDEDEEKQDLEDAKNDEFIGEDEEDELFKEEIEQAEIDELLAK